MVLQYCLMIFSVISTLTVARQSIRESNSSSSYVPECFRGTDGRRNLKKAVKVTTDKIKALNLIDYKYQLERAQNNIFLCPFYIEVRNGSTTSMKEQEKVYYNHTCYKAGLPEDFGGTLTDLFTNMQKPFARAETVCWTPIYHEDKSIDIHVEIYPDSRDPAKDQYVSITNISPLSNTNPLTNNQNAIMALQLQNQQYSTMVPNYQNSGATLTSLQQQLLQEQLLQQQLLAQQLANQQQMQAQQLPIQALQANIPISLQPQPVDNNYQTAYSLPIQQAATTYTSNPSRVTLNNNNVLNNNVNNLNSDINASMNNNINNNLGNLGNNNLNRNIYALNNNINALNNNINSLSNNIYSTSTAFAQNTDYNSNNNRVNTNNINNNANNFLSTQNPPLNLDNIITNNLNNNINSNLNNNFPYNGSNMNNNIINNASNNINNSATNNRFPANINPNIIQNINAAVLNSGLNNNNYANNVLNTDINNIGYTSNVNNNNLSNGINSNINGNNSNNNFGNIPGIQQLSSQQLYQLQQQLLQPGSTQLSAQQQQYLNQLQQQLQQQQIQAQQYQPNNIDSTNLIKNQNTYLPQQSNQFNYPSNTPTNNNYIDNNNYGNYGIYANQLESEVEDEYEYDNEDDDKYLLTIYKECYNSGEDSKEKNIITDVKNNWKELKWKDYTYEISAKDNNTLTNNCKSKVSIKGDTMTRDSLNNCSNKKFILDLPLRFDDIIDALVLSNPKGNYVCLTVETFTDSSSDYTLTSDNTAGNMLTIFVQNLKII